MIPESPIRILLGPQRPQQNLSAAVADAGLPEGPLAVISAGWQEAEGDIAEIARVVERPLEDLRLYLRADDVANQVADLAAATRRRQDRLTELQRLYRLRLKQLGIAARHTFGVDGDADIIAGEQRHAIAQLRALDRHHLYRSESIWREFLDAYNKESIAPLAKHVDEIATIVDSCAGILITGGNIAVLINRMRLFGVDHLLADRNIIAWSAGAMALAERIVLFHDRSPEGRRDAEVFGAGCGVLPGYIVLPDTQHRLRTGDRRRVKLLCRRFSPDVCMALDNGAELGISGADVVRQKAVRRLAPDGRLRSVRAA